MIPKLDLTVYLGGVRSGKSILAEAQAIRSGGSVLYVATADTHLNDAAMHERIQHHQSRRPAQWRTLECPLHLAHTLATILPSFSADQYNSQVRPTILVDCVTLWVSNILFSLTDPSDSQAFENAVQSETGALLQLMETSDCRWIVVSGESGLGGVALSPVSRTYCDGLGLANQLLVAQASQAFLVIAGRLLELKESFKQIDVR